MKPIYTLFILLFLGFQSSAQTSIDQVLRKYRNDAGVMNLNFTGDALLKFAKNPKDIKSKIDKVDILVFENKKGLDASDIAKIATLLKTNKYDQLIDIKGKDGKAQLFAIDAGSHLTKVYGSVASQGYSAVFEITGKVIFEELSNLGLNFDGKAQSDLFKSLNKK